MSIVRCYYPDPLKLNSTVTFSPDKSHHLIHVLRLKKGASLALFNGNGQEYEAELTTLNRNQATALITNSRPASTEPLLKIHLGQAIASPDRMDWSIQKAVELGCNTITPLFTQFCQIRFTQERLEKKLAHWKGIAIHAAEQCGRTTVPCIQKSQNFIEWLSTTPPGLKLIAHHEGVHPFPKPKTKPTVCTICIGPEGGFSDSEISLAKQYYFLPISMGPRILRTETATVVALTILQILWGDMS